MIEANFYAITALVSAAGCFAVLRCNNKIFEHESTIRSYFSFLLINFIICQLIDSLWGFANTGTLAVGRTGFYIISFAIHVYIIFAAACWCIFLTSYFGYRETRAIMILQCIPLLATVGIMITQLTDNSVFLIDEAGVYHTGPLRLYLFYIQYSYYAITFLKVLYFLLRNRKEHDFRYKGIVLNCAVLPAIFGLLQYGSPNAPFCSLGLVFSAVLVFNGMMVIEKSRQSKKFEIVSKDNYMTLEAVSEGFVAVIMLDLEKGTDIAVKSTPYVTGLVDDDVPLRERVLSPFMSSATPEYVEDLREFADIDTLPERMDNRRSLSMQYCSKEMGWCILTFLAAERDEERVLKKVVLAVQSIDEYKKKEKEYENALARAYENENAIFAELIRMQSAGVLASGEDHRIMVANDEVLEMFGYTDIDPIGMDIFEFWAESSINTISDDVKKQYDEVEKNGGSFTYQTVSHAEGSKKDIRYLMAEAKRVDLLDGEHVMVTCFTDFTAGKLLNDKLKTLSETDALTGISNRRCGESQIKLLMDEGIEGAYCLFDVNEFKRINDNFGHKTGDDTLVAVARAVRSSFRSDDIFMRLGGDEFAIYMRGVVTPDLAKIRIARLFENIARIELPNVPKGSVTISLGAVMVKSADGVIEEDLSSVYKRADALMYRCKGKPGSNLEIERI